MSQQLNTRSIGNLKAATDLSAKQFYIMKFDSTAEQFAIATLDSDNIGVLQNKPKQYEAGTIAVGETTKVILGDTVTYGAELVSDANGKAIPKAANNNVCLIALEAGVVNDIIEALVVHYYHA